MTARACSCLIALSLLGFTACGDDGGEATGTDPGSTSAAPTTTETPTSGTPTSGTPTTGATTDVDESSTGVDPSGDPSTGLADGSSSGSADDSSGGGDSTGAEDGFTVSGAVVSDLNSGDLTGTLYVGLLAACTQEAERVGSAIVKNADVSGNNAVMFAIPGMADGTYYVGGFLDADENSDPEDPGPSTGDPVAADGFAPGCVEVTVAGADVVAPEALVLNLAYPL